MKKIIAIVEDEPDYITEKTTPAIHRLQTTIAQSNEPAGFLLASRLPDMLSIPQRYLNTINSTETFVL